jgi:hypothetical protein
MSFGTLTIIAEARAKTRTSVNCIFAVLVEFECKIKSMRFALYCTSVFGGGRNKT